jgi:hypothetical protein
MSLMTSERDALAVSQTPTFESLPEATSSAGDDVIEFAASVGLYLDPWQQHVCRGGLRERGRGWAAFEVSCTVPRQNGKGAVLEARELAEILLFGGGLVVHTAHLLSTSEEARTRMEQIIEDSPDLDRQVKRIVRSNGKEAIEFKNGGRIKYVARSKGGGRGWTGSLIVFDEDMFLPASTMAALIPTLATAKLPQLWYMGSAGLAESDHKRALRERALRGDQNLAYFEWAAPEDVDLDDRFWWARTNPRVTLDYIEKERGAITADEDFARERLGIWQLRNGVTVIPAGDWAACCDPESTPGSQVSFAVDAAPDGAGSSVAIASKRPDGRIHVEIVEYRTGTDWVAGRVAELVAKWSPYPREVSVDPGGPAGHLAVELEAAGVKVRAVTPRELAQACGRFYTEAVAHELAHLDDRSLNVALGAAKKRPVGDAWVWQRRDITNISPLVAATLAVDAHVRALATPKPQVFVPRRLA